MKTWKALILGGGGSTGEFQIGALPVICSHYDKINMFVGVGVGSLHASVLAQYDSLNEGTNVLVKLWRNINKTSDILSAPIVGADIGTLLALASDKASARDGAYNNKKLKKIIDQYISWDDLKDKENWAIRLTSLSDGRLYTVSNHKGIANSENQDGHKTKFSLDPNSNFYIGNQLSNIVVGAGSVPLMLPPVDIFGHRFVEGGLRDFTPLDLAVKAFLLDPKKDEYDKAEFIIIDNYKREVDFETPELLDSGNEIILRAIKIMTVEMAQNDITKGLKAIEDNGINAEVMLMQPQKDFRMHPMNFNDHDKRKNQRRHGAEVALTVLRQHNIDHAEAIARINQKLKNNEITEELIEQIVEEVKKDPEKMRSALDPNIKLKSNDHLAKRYNPIDESKIKRPESLQELKAIMLQNASSDKKIKALGSGYAFSNILDTTGVQIGMEKLNTVFGVKRSHLKDPNHADTHIAFEAGATIQDLNQKLWPIGRTLLNQPGYEHLNYFGVCTTGGHGSGLSLGPIANAIRSMNLLTIDENQNLKEYRIEPKDGITDPLAYKASHPGIELIQDDDVFNSCIVSVGTFGIVYSLIVETQVRFLLEEKRYFTHWEDEKNNIFTKLRAPDIHSVHIWLNPYKVKGKTGCVISEYRKHPGPIKGNRPWGTSWYIVEEATPFIEFLTTNWPKEVPKILNASLKQTVNRRPVVMTNPKALNFGAPNHALVHATNCAIPADKSIEFVDAMHKLFKKRFDDDLYVTAPVGLRYTSPGTGLISPQYDRESCMIELPILQGTDGANNTIAAFHEMVFNDFEGRPHWGQINRSINKDRFKSMFPKWKTFVQQFDRFNKGHFDNAFTEQIKIRELINEL